MTSARVHDTPENDVAAVGPSEGRGGPFEILYADPAWEHDDRASDGQRGASFKYQTMSLDDICALDVQRHMAPESALFLWAVSPMLPEAFKVMEAWGYTYSTVAFCWAKTRGPRTDEVRKIVRARLPGLRARADGITDDLLAAGLVPRKWHIGMGQTTRCNVEMCLLGLRGRLGRVDAGVRQLVTAPLGAHSAKPPEIRDMIVRLLGDRPRLEMFARERTPGWSIWGNQAPGGSDVEILPREPGALAVVPPAPAVDPRQITIFDLGGVG